MNRNFYFIGIAFFGMINGIFNQLWLIFALLYVQPLVGPLLFGSLSLTLMFASLMVSTATVILGGIPAAIYERVTGSTESNTASLWIWLAIGVLVLVIGAMYPMGSMHYANVRRAVGLKAYGDPKDAPPSEPLPPAELEKLLASNRPFALAAVGGIGLAIIIWLMVVKPF